MVRDCSKSSSRTTHSEIGAENGGGSGQGEQEKGWDKLRSRGLITTTKLKLLPSSSHLSQRFSTNTDLRSRSVTRTSLSWTDIKITRTLSHRQGLRKQGSGDVSCARWWLWGGSRSSCSGTGSAHCYPFCTKHQTWRGRLCCSQQWKSLAIRPSSAEREFRSSQLPAVVKQTLSSRLFESKAASKALANKVVDISGQALNAGEAQVSQLRPRTARTVDRGVVRLQVHVRAIFPSALEALNSAENSPRSTPSLGPRFEQDGDGSRRDRAGAQQQSRPCTRLLVVGPLGRDWQEEEN